jgi:phosphatidylserine/phosphatidylglycerophosphate/cardiolipin synthase-like enzyme
MNDIFATWFLQDGEAVVSSSRSVETRHANRVTAFIEVRDYYQDFAESVAKTEGGRGNFVLISGWGFDEKTPLDPPVDGQSTIGDLLRKVGSRSVPVLALIWAHIDGSNRAAVNWFNNLPSGSAIHDDRVLFCGSHHQKFAVVLNRDGLVAYCGGMDFGSDRLKGGAYNRPWHDVQVRVIGTGAVDLWRTFYNRWIDQIGGPYGPYTCPRPLYPQAADPPGSGQSVQILCTFGNGSQHLGLNTRKTLPEPNFLQFRRQGRAYQFAPTGERSIYRLLIKAIRATRFSIYLEDQYLVASEPIQSERSLTWELSKILALPSFQGMIVLTNGVGTIQGELFQVNYRRQRFWDQVSRLAPGKISVWAYKGGPTSPYWMHSKTWIFDDILAIVGSANCNRRGYCHDSEIAVAVLDPKAAENLPFAHDLRVKLWLKHLNSRKARVSQKDVVDFAQGMKLWVDNGDTDLSRLNLTVAEASQPDRSIFDPATPKASKGGWRAFFRGLEQAFKPVLGPGPYADRDFEWDNIIDPDGS